MVLPAPSDQGFGDVAGSVHADRIDQLAQLGVVREHDASTFGPHAEVGRDQMTSILLRAYETLHGAPLPHEPSRFVDVAGNTHLVNIEKAAAAGFTQSRTATTYAPDQPVRRDQLGSFLARMLQLATADGHLAPPTS